MPPKLILVIDRKIKIRDERHFKEWRKEEGVKSLLDNDDIEISDFESLEHVRYWRDSLLLLSNITVVEQVLLF